MRYNILLYCNSSSYRNAPPQSSSTASAIRVGWLKMVMCAASSSITSLARDSGATAAAAPKEVALEWGQVYHTPAGSETKPSPAKDAANRSRNSDSPADTTEDTPTIRKNAAFACLLVC